VRSMGVKLPPFQSLVDAYWPDVARLAHALAGPGHGDDVAQQAWAQALSAYPALRSAKNLRSWLLTITARCATDSFRGRRELPVASPAEVRDQPEPSADPGEAPSEPALWAAVRCLPERQRTAIALRYVADLDHTHLALALGITPAASRRLVSDALRTLRERTEKEFDR
jgi:RNA polymerase sigma factor (sigma-70 family)